MVAIVNAPSRLNPKKYPERSIVRRNLVLDRMRDAGNFSSAQCDSLKKLEIKLNFHNPDYRTGLATYMREPAPIEKLVREKIQTPMAANGIFMKMA